MEFQDPDFESLTILKIMHILHKAHFQCEQKTFENFELFGRWGFAKNLYPIQSCSFCARFYELETKQTNGWPLSTKAIEKIRMDSIKSLSNIPLGTNNKFCKIFNPENIAAKPAICCCNEISKKPNEYCSVHDQSNIVGTATIQNTNDLL